MSAPRRIGFFGGAFDPPHLAHLSLAKTAIAQFALDELKVIPTGNAWHKSRPLSPAHHRLAMTQRAFAELPQIAVDPRETKRDGPTYTIETLTALQQEQPHCAWWLFIGEDQAERFQIWRDWQRILSLAQLVIAQRVNDEAAAVANRQWHNALKPAPELLAMPPMEMSATEIRRRLRRGQNVDRYLSPIVQDYIQQHHLYLDNHE